MLFEQLKYGIYLSFIHGLHLGGRSPFLIALLCHSNEGCQHIFSNLIAK